MLRSILPSMFHRRLLLLAALAGVGAAALGAQMYRLGVVRGEELRGEAQRWLVRRNYVPAPRGSIIDRKGRILAQDRPTYDVLVDYRVITGQWAEDRARESARRAAGSRWLDLSPEERLERIATRRVAFQVHLDRAWDQLASATGLARAEIDARRDEIIAEVERKFERVVAGREREEASRLVGSDANLSTRQRASLDRRIRRPIHEQESPHILIRRVGDQAGFACMKLAGELVDVPIPAEDGGIDTETTEIVPGVQIVDSGERIYPLESMVVEVDRSTLPGPLRGEGSMSVQVDGLACHVLGSVRDKVFGDSRDERGNPVKGDLARRREFLAQNPQESKRSQAPGVFGLMGFDRGEYREGDRVGSFGVEASQEHTLRGLRGVRTRYLKSGEDSTIPAEAGRGVQLTIDIALQARIQAVMQPQVGLCVVQPWHKQVSGTQPLGTPLFGAAVVLDVDTGDILAMVSTPTFTREQFREHPESIFGQTPDLMVSQPGVNRCVQKIYQPGSIVKALVFTEAVTHAKCAVDGTIACHGHLIPGQPDRQRCWVFKQSNGEVTHNLMFGHDPNGVEALMQSCNIYFFTLGQRLGSEGIRRLYSDFGVGKPYRLGLGYEVGGLMGARDPRTGERSIRTGDAIQMGIGQGPVSWTPLHAADAYATLARSGVRVPPRVIVGVPRDEPTELGLDARAISTALEGLRRAVNDDMGTGHHVTFDTVREPTFNTKGVKVWGKTGTAASSPIYFDPDGKGPEPPELLEEGDHSWFVVLAGKDRPRYAIAVVIDFGGSGGKVSGPVCNQIIHALKTEGYFEDK